MRRAGGQVGGWAVGTAALFALVITAIPSTRLSAYPPTRLPANPPTRLPAQVPDTAHHITPVGALWRSLLVPGWGQAATGRDVTGALFVVWEGVTAMMTLKAAQERRYLRQAGSASGNVTAKRQEVQDWTVLWIFNHLFSAAEAFVSAHLLDFPKELKLDVAPGRLGVSITPH